MRVNVAVDFSARVSLNLSTEHPSSCSAVAAGISFAELHHQITVVISYRIL